MSDKIDQTCVKQSAPRRLATAINANKVISTAVLAWACWLITRIADRVFEDPGAINLHTVSALALIVGTLATVIALWQSVRSKVGK